MLKNKINFLSAEEAAARLNVTSGTVRRWIRSGRLKARVGYRGRQRIHLIPEDVVATFKPYVVLPEPRVRGRSKRATFNPFTFLQELPEQFTTAEFLKAGNNFGRGKSVLFEKLAFLRDKGLIKALSRGLWTKTA